MFLLALGLVTGNTSRFGRKGWHEIAYFRVPVIGVLLVPVTNGWAGFNGQWMVVVCLSTPEGVTRASRILPIQTDELRIKENGK